MAAPSKVRTAGDGRRPIAPAVAVAITATLVLAVTALRPAPVSAQTELPEILPGFHGRGYGVISEGPSPWGAPAERAYRFDLSAPTDHDVSFTVQSVRGTAQGAVDYARRNQKVVTIPAGQTIGKLLVPTFDDDVVEGPEWFTLHLSNPVGATLGATQSHVVIDDNDYPTPGLYARLLVLRERETVGFPIANTDDRKGWVTGARLQTQRGTAQGGVDYQRLRVQLEVGVWQSWAYQPPVFVHAIDDTVSEDTEWFTIVLDKPVGLDVVQAYGHVVIVDDD